MDFKLADRTSCPLPLPVLLPSLDVNVNDATGIHLISSVILLPAVGMTDDVKE